MKRIFIALMLALAVVLPASAQRYIVVDSEKIFRSIEEYNKALTSLDALAKDYQSKVDVKFREVESLYNSYMAQKAALPSTTRAEREQAILAREKAATEYQESIFGNDGVLMKRRVELIQPIQSRVFTAIEQYAKAGGYDMVLDKASNVAMLYNSDSVDHTQAIIDMLKK